MQRRLVAVLISIAAAITLVASAGAAVIARGTFVSIDNEPAAGNVTVVKIANGSRILRFTKTAIGPGPALRIYLVAGIVNASTDVKVFRDLGRLKATTGSQSYTIPRSVDVRRFRTVVVWCADFSVAFGKAVLRPV